MLLSRYNLRNVNTDKVVLPNDALFELPEKVLQFGTGVLLRGLPDYFIDKANRHGIFNGRIVVVKSTSRGDSASFEKQDCLYTLCERGIENGKKVEDNIVCSAISRVLSARHEWAAVLECAHNPQMQVIISNTTEVGIKMVNENIRKHPPVSFPAKLLAFLYERYIAFDGSSQSGMVILPTELISNNAKKLESILLELAHLNSLDEHFIEWLENCNHFCNSLVDRIVPGGDKNIKAEIEQEIGLTDDLLIVSEVYRLWAIEGNATVADILTFATADHGVIITEDINPYRELKLGLLNATHSLSCGVAFLSGIRTVKKAMDESLLAGFIADLVLQDIAPVITQNHGELQAEDFGHKVLERFRNPYIEHYWISISLNYTQKMKVRVVPLLISYYETFKAIPENIAIGFAAYLLFMKAVRTQEGQYFGDADGKEYPISDEKAAWFFQCWKKFDIPTLVNVTLQDTELWEFDLTAIPGFEQDVTDKLIMMMANGQRVTLQNKKALQEK